MTMSVVGGQSKNTKTPVKKQQNTSKADDPRVKCFEKRVPKWGDTRIERARTETFWIFDYTYFYWLKNSKHETTPQSKHQFIPLSLRGRQKMFVSGKRERYWTKFKMFPFVSALFVRHATSEQTWIYLVLNRQVTELSPLLVDILLKLSFLPLLRRFRCTLFVRLHFPFLFTENPRPCLLITSFFLL